MTGVTDGRMDGRTNGFPFTGALSHLQIRIELSANVICLLNHQYQSIWNDKMYGRAPPSPPPPDPVVITNISAKESMGENLFLNVFLSGQAM